MFGEDDRESCSPIGFGAEDDLSSKLGGQLAADRQSQSLAGDRGMLVAAEAVEGLEDLRLRIGGDSRAIVFDGKDPRIAIKGGFDPHATSRRRVGDGVVDQVVEDPGASLGVGDDPGVGRFNDRFEGEPPIARFLTKFLVELGDDRAQGQIVGPGWFVGFGGLGVFEAAAGHAQQVVAQFSDRRDVATMLGRDGLRSLAKKLVESSPQPCQRLAEFLAETAQQDAQVSLVRRVVLDVRCGGKGKLIARGKMRVHTAGLGKAGRGWEGRVEAVDEGPRQPRGENDSGDGDLIGQKGMAVGQIKDRLVGELLGVVRSRASVQDDAMLGVVDVEIANSSAGDQGDVSLDQLGSFLVSPTESKAFMDRARALH